MPPDVDGSAERPALKECDLVMKGGITSGIVYPPLVIELKDTYRFRCVGGTSAGALAAAATAAAEHGRERGGFTKLVRVNDLLKSDGFVESLFQPSPSTRPLFDTAVTVLTRRAEQKALEKKSGAKPAASGAFTEWLGALMLLTRILPTTSPDAYKAGSRVGLLYGLGIAVVMALFASSVFFVAAGVTIGWGAAVKPVGIAFAVLALLPALALVYPSTRIGGVIRSADELYRILTKRVPENHFGVCTGRRTQEQEALTDWLNGVINDLAGLPVDGAPLTFGDLWGTRDPKAERALDLRMVTSNVSQHQPYVVPFARDLFLFKQSDIEALFPKNIADHMVAKSRRAKGFKLPPGYFFLPAAADLPVLFAARMSMSFPVLISMVPLYTLSHKAFERACRFNAIEVISDGAPREHIVLRARNKAGFWVTPEGEERAVAEEHLQLNWFSDGGICSNFPIHFFDSWLPTRPTFGVNLTTQLADAEAGDPAAVKDCVRDRSSYAVQQASDEVFRGDGALDGQQEGDEQRYERDVYLPKPDSDPSPAWRPLPTLGSFLDATVKTAQEFRDTMQAMLPSYRERIVQVRLTDEEGGINLSMPHDVIQKVVGKGTSAGEVLKNDFDFQQHQWVRFRVLMSQMESGFAKIRTAMLAGPEGAGYRSLLDLQRQSAYPYQRDQAWTDEVTVRLDRMSEFLDAWSDPADLFGREPRPMPEPLLRVTPEL